MNAIPAAKVYVKPAFYKEQIKRKPPSPAIHEHEHPHSGAGAKLKHVNEVQVVGTGELFLAPDRCRLSVAVRSQKSDVDEVKNSVTRRLDYIVQVMHNHGVKVCYNVLMTNHLLCIFFIFLQMSKYK